MKISRTMVLLTGLVFMIPGLANATTPHKFYTGKPARAAEVNANFEALEQRLLQLESYRSRRVAVDCSADANAFLNTRIRNNIVYTLSGMCNGPVWIENRSNVTIEGDDNGTRDDGVILQAGLTENPYAAIGVWNSKAIKLDNLTISAANYVSQSYVFGENISSLAAGDQSLVDAANIDFIGGDYSVRVYNGSQLTLRESVSITGFNRRGLDAYNHGLIRTHNDITVTGIVGSSTDTYPYAISAINNSIVEIKDGGSFTGASGQPVDDYATAVWSGDNSTIRFDNGANPATVTGAIESAYSSMVRISGNLTLNGTLAAYHRGYIRATGTMQSGGEIYAGDAATIRFESSNLTPSSVIYPDSPVEVYRQGNLRMNDTTVNLGGGALYVSGFGFLNLRGATDFGGADIFCHDRNQISIRNSVTGVGTVSCYEP